MRLVLWSLLVVILLLSAAWPPGTSSMAMGPERWSITDPQGDAYQPSTAELAWEPYMACTYTLELGHDTCESTAPHQETPEHGVPGPPGIDILAIHIDETPTDLVVVMEVARLDEGLKDAVSDESHGAIWTVCWEAFECVQAAALHGDGKVERQGYLLAFVEPTCGADMEYCLVPTNVGFEPGAPGRVIWQVPRALLFGGDAGSSLDNVTAFTASMEEDRWTTLSLTSPLRSVSGYHDPRFWVVDRAEAHTSYMIHSTSASRLEDVTSSEHADMIGDAPFPDADVGRVVYHENATTFAAAIQMGRVAADSPAFAGIGITSFTTGPSFYWKVQRDEKGIDGRITTCGDDACSYTVPGPGRFEFREGSPGWINLSWDRAALGHPPAGTRVAAFWFGTEASNTTSVDEPAAEASLTEARAADIHALGPVYAFVSGGLPPEAVPAEPIARATVIHDPAHDAASEQPAVDTASGMFDLVLAGVEGTSPTTSRVTIGIRDLSRVAVPAGAKAVTYTVAVETATGATMIGLYRDASRGEFFCASDTLVLSDEKHDPAEAAWTRLDGILSLAPSGGGGVTGRSGAPSTITVFVPHACFGVEGPGTISARSLTAAVHVIPQEPVAGVPVQRIETVDEASDPSLAAFTLGTPSPTSAAVPWYSQPFGIDGFWDIMGIALAVLLPAVGILAMRRRRSMLTRYMTRIDRTLSIHAHETKAREATLQSIRRDLKDDALRGRISEGHFLLVDARLAEHLKQARVHGLTAAFGDLPHRLLQKLLEILADGTITSEEARRFGALLEDSDLTKQARSRIQRKLDLWVADDTV